MYDVSRMKEQIENAILKVEKSVRSEFKQAFKEIYKNKIVPEVFSTTHDVCLYKVSNPTDLKKISYGEGFYFILTDYKVDNNDCSLTYKDGIKAIYRGECRTVKKRIQSHLFNEKYNIDYQDRKEQYLAKLGNKKKKFHEQHWPACLKIRADQNGINIDTKEYCKSNWFIVVHKMKGSSQAVRIQAELAFDEVFSKPVASRERTK